MKVIDFVSYIKVAEIVDKFLNSELDAMCIYRTLVAIERLLTTTLQPLRDKLSPAQVENDKFMLDKLIVIMANLCRAREEMLEHEGFQFTKAVADATLEKVKATGVLDKASEEESNLVIDVLGILTRIEEDQLGTRTTNEAEKKHTQLLSAATAFMASVEQHAKREPDDRIGIVLDGLLDSDIADDLRACLGKEDKAE